MVVQLYVISEEILDFLGKILLLMHWRVEIHDHVVVLQQSQDKRFISNSWFKNAVPAYKMFLSINMFGNNMTTCYLDGYRILLE